VEWARWVGVTLQVVGLVWALSGLRMTRLAYAPDEPGAFDWLTVPLRKGGGWARLHLFRGRKHATKHVSTSWLVAHATVTASGQVAYSPIDPSLPVADQLRLLDERTRIGRDVLNQLELDAIHDRENFNEANERVETLERDMRSHVDSSVRALAVSGLRGSAWGLVITLVGTIVAAFAP
jgi:hypothetical protein